MEVFALLDQGIPKAKVAEMTGVSRTSIIKWSKEDKGQVEQVAAEVIEPGAREVATRKTSTLASVKKRQESLLEKVWMGCFDSGMRDLEKMNPYQRMVAGGIAFDKLRLLRGESTQNHAHVIGSLAGTDLD